MIAMRGTIVLRRRSLRASRGHVIKLLTAMVYT